MLEPHPAWGRPFDQYTLSYGFEAHKKMDSLTSGTKIDPDEAISQICKLGSQVHEVNQNDDANQIIVSTLESVLKFARSPGTLHHFICPPLISGCIRLMAMVKQSGKHSPFSYEYGYLCFRIITIALGVCVLERSNNLDSVVEDMLSRPGEEPLLILSEQVSRVLRNEILGASPEPDCEWLLGWVKSPNHPQQEIVISHTDVSTLLDVLWEDRKLFLEAFTRTFSPGLSAVIFSLWRYLYVERPTTQSPSPAKEPLAARFCEIFWRYLLVAPADQTSPLAHMNNTISEVADAWEKNVRYIDLEDSRTILLAYSNRLASTGSRLNGPFVTSAIPFLLRFMVPFVQPGSEDLLPFLVRSTLNRFWEILITKGAQNGFFPESLGMSCSGLGKIFENLRQTLLSDGYAMPQVLEAMSKSNMLDLVCRAMILMKPAADESSPEFDRNTRFFSNIYFLFSQLTKAAPRWLFDLNFGDYVRDWLKYMRYLTALGDCTDKRNAMHFHECRQLWLRIAVFLGYQDELAKLQAFNRCCAYPRCASPELVGGAQFICAQCGEIPYCSTRCQALDWMPGVGRSSHRVFCEILRRYGTYAL